MVKKQGSLIPLINMLCSAHDDSVTTVSDQESIQSQMIFLLLCPNVLLCEQVVRMVNVFVAMMVNRYIKLQLSVMGRCFICKLFL